MMKHRSKSNLWKCHRFGRVSKTGKTGMKAMNDSLSDKRISAGFEYIGDQNKS